MRVITNIRDDLVRKELLFIVDGVQINIAIMEIILGVSQKLKVELPYDLAISLFGIYSKTSYTAIEIFVPHNWN